MNRPRFWRQGSIIIDAENDWQEVGTYQDIAAEVLELRAETARLRSLLPDADTRRDIREWANEHSNVRAALVLAWLKRLEAESEATP